MDKIQGALQAILEAEKSLRRLIAEAAASGEYAVLPELARLADGLAKLSRAEAETALEEPAAQQPPPTPTVLVRRTGAVAKTDYPLFETDEDRLVKIGWSKKDRTTYEHRVGREVAEAVSVYLADQLGKGTFRMDDLLPVEIDGQEVPLYQAYLVLAWLRYRALIAKDGKDGYRWQVKTFDEATFQDHWLETPARAHS